MITITNIYFHLYVTTNIIIIQSYKKTSTQIFTIIRFYKKPDIIRLQANPSPYGFIALLIRL